MSTPHEGSAGTSAVFQESEVSFMTPYRLAFLPTLLIVGNLLNQASAQEPKAAAPETRYPEETAVTFEWDYSCPNASCSFSCPGHGGASHVTKLTMRLGTLPVGTLQHIPALLYSFSTTETEKGSGFIVAAGLSTLACQVNGMTEDYAGPSRFDRQGLNETR
jgi:hypothetical protein